MGNRKYYVLAWHRDYDGHEHIIEYVGTNYAALKARYRWLFDFLKQREFLDEGIAEERIEARFNDLPATMEPGQSYYAYMNDNDCFYIDIEVRCMYTNSFCNRQMEDRYKLDFPDSKY